MNRNTLDDITHRSDYFGSTIGRFGLLFMISLEMHFESSKVVFNLMILHIL